MKTYTPEPWHFEKHNKQLAFESGGPGNSTYYEQVPIVLIVAESNADPRVRTCIAQLDQSTHMESNARLIAAAPELLEACKAALRLDYMQEHNALANQLREAVAKAEGTK